MTGKRVKRSLIAGIVFFALTVGWYLYAAMPGESFLNTLEPYDAFTIGLFTALAIVLAGVNLYRRIGIRVRYRRLVAKRGRAF